MAKRAGKKAPVMVVLSETLGPPIEQDLIDADPSLSNGVRFVEVPTAALVKLETDDGRDVTGAYVKLAPRLRKSQRAAFDVGAAERALLARGALAVIASPVTVPDRVERAPRAVPSVVDARGEVRNWFGEPQAGSDSAAALAQCLVILDEVGF